MKVLLGFKRPHNGYRILYTLLISLWPYILLAQKADFKNLRQLNEAIGQSEKYDEEKLTRIEQLRESLDRSDQNKLFDSYLKLYDEYALFHSDSASYYAIKLQETATQIGDPKLKAYAQLKLSTILLYSGMFKEAYDSLQAINSRVLTDDKKSEYYAVMARYYYDLADYNLDDYYRPQYNKLGSLYLDSSVSLSPVNSFNYAYFNGLKEVRNLHFKKAQQYFEELLESNSLTHHEIALTSSTLSDIYIRNGETDSAVNLLVAAAIADIRSSTKETSAVFNLATLLFNSSDVENSSILIEKAAVDANFYGARQRNAKLSIILPLIKEQKLRTTEAQKTNISRYAVVVTLSFVLMTILTIIIVRQVNKLKSQKKEIGQNNEVLKHLLEEKEWLLKEIHHRVKNNLQTIVSLLESQSSYLESDALVAVQNSQHRVYAMSLIHQKLYQSDNLGIINMSTYLPDLVNYLSDSFQVNNRIKFDLSLENIELDISQAIPIGLILNEAITNSIKYAFRDETSNQIRIEMKMKASGDVRLVISDNGIGLSEKLQRNDGNQSLGFKLMKGLTEDIGGTLDIRTQNGTSIIVEFKINKLREVNELFS